MRTTTMSKSTGAALSADGPKNTDPAPTEKATRWPSDEWFLSDPSVTTELYVAAALGELEERRRQVKLSDRELRERLDFLFRF